MELLISADSHVFEPIDLWRSRLPERFRNASLPISQAQAKSFAAHPGGTDPQARLSEMKTDGVSAEVLYPTVALGLFGLDDPALQRACFEVYNDWLCDYCAVAPERLLGIALIACYDIDEAVEDLRRYRARGLRGAEVWMAPVAGLPFYSAHYDRFWAAAQEVKMPVSLHILTGHDYSRKLFDDPRSNSLEWFRGPVNRKLDSVMTALYDIMFSGVFQRFPGLRLVLVENEIGWLPFVIQQWDYYFKRFRDTLDLPIKRLPSEYFADNVFATFFNDAVGCRQLGFWGTTNCMWSNDFPHPNSTWPKSREKIDQLLGHLPPDQRASVLSSNVANLYGIKTKSLTA
ncbi:MAG: amidohydrolase [Candidatus Binataceae bacterium]|nr:amidohydrolase [Candidatus Binataceae bacterium]